MKTVLYLPVLLVMMWLSLLQVHAQGKLPGMPRPQYPRADEERSLRIARDAPYVFGGWVIQLERFYDPKTDRIYSATVFEITHVFRGGPDLKPGTVELIDSMGFFQGRGANGWAGTPFGLGDADLYRVYFARPSDFPANPNPNRVDNARRVRPYERNWSRVVTTRQFKQPAGLRWGGFDSWDEFNRFIAQFPNITPLPGPFAQQYELRRNTWVDTRPGRQPRWNTDIAAQAQAERATYDAAEARQQAARRRNDSVLRAALPAARMKVFTGQPLSAHDSAVLRRLMPGDLLLNSIRRASPTPAETAAFAALLRAPAPSTAIPGDLTAFARARRKALAGEPLTSRDSALLRRHAPLLLREHGTRVRRADSLRRAGRPTGARPPVRRTTATEPDPGLFRDTTLHLALRRPRIVHDAACAAWYEVEVWGHTNRPLVHPRSLMAVLQLSENVPLFDTLPFADYNPDVRVAPLGWMTGQGLRFAPFNDTGYLPYLSWDKGQRTLVVLLGAPLQVPCLVLPQAPAPLYRVRVRLAPGAAALSAALVNTDEVAAYSYYTPTSSPSDYDGRFFTKIRFDANAAPIPRTLAVVDGLRRGGTRRVAGGGDTVSVVAGVSDTLELRGTGFGCRQPTTAQRGQVQFRNADRGGQLPDGTALYLQGLDEEDYLVWTDSLIRVRVPASGPATPSVSGDKATPGSGPVRVLTAAGALSNPATSPGVDIRAVVQNDGFGQGTDPKERYYLASTFCSPGVTFTLGQNVLAYPQALPVIETALAAWAGRVGIPLALARYPDGRYKTRNVSVATSGDSTHVIFIDPGLPRSTAMGTSRNDVQKCIGTLPGNVNRKVQLDADIAINMGPDIEWDYGLSGGVTGLDFYHAILHEIGHFLGLDHVLETKDLMYWQAPKSPTASQRLTLSSGRGASAATAAGRIVPESRAIDWNGNQPAYQLATLGTRHPSCGQKRGLLSTTQVEEADDALRVYPNPFGAEATVHVPTRLGPAVRLSLCDALGRVVWQQVGAWPGQLLPLGTGLSPGLYVLRADGPAGQRTAQLVKAW